jgi:hypothetical protein
LPAWPGSKPTPSSRVAAGTGVTVWRGPQLDQGVVLGCSEFPGVVQQVLKDGANEPPVSHGQRGLLDAEMDAAVRFAGLEFNGDGHGFGA